MNKKLEMTVLDQSPKTGKAITKPGFNVGVCVSEVRMRQSTFFGVVVSINRGCVVSVDEPLM